MATAKTAQAGSNQSLPAMFPGTTQVVAFTAASAQSTALGSGLVRLCATQDCWVKFGTNPTADTSASILLPAGVVEYFGCSSTDKLAVIRNSADGSLAITPAVEV